MHFRRVVREAIVIFHLHEQRGLCYVSESSFYLQHTHTPSIYIAAALALACVSANIASPIATPPVPHNDPWRRIPSEEAPAPIDAPIVDDEWWSECIRVGSCQDLGVACEPGGTSADGTGWAMWCTGAAARGACEFGALASCQDFSTPIGCGAEWTGACLNNGLVSESQRWPTQRDCVLEGCRPL